MFALPSLWNLLISTVVFIVAAKYLRQYLEQQGLPTGMTRGTLVFILASLLSWGSGELVDWSTAKITGTPAPVQNSADLQQVLQLINATKQ